MEKAVNIQNRQIMTQKQQFNFMVLERPNNFMVLESRLSFNRTPWGSLSSTIKTLTFLVKER